MRKTQLYSMTGFLLGWGAPLGAMALRFFTARGGGSLLDFVDREWTTHAFFYWYMLLGTCLVLSVVGWLLGDAADLDQERNRESLGS
jgi:hypothetical protein